MPRPIVCFAFLETALSASLHSEMKLDAVMKDHGAALEKTYRGLLENLIKNPNDKAYVPNTSYMDAARQQFTFLKNDLETQRDENQELIDHANRQVALCNEAAYNWFNAPDTGINALKAKADAQATVHSQCRVVEQEKIDTFDASKADFDSQNSAGCTNEQDWWASDATGDGTFSALVAAGVQTKADKAAKELQEAQCDKEQHDYEEAFCKYALLLDEKCEVHTTCYAAKKESREDIQPTVEELETSQKLVWKMVQKVECYIGKIELAAERNPTAADLEECTNLIPTAGQLDVTYTPPDAPMVCDTSPAANKPGSQGWLDQEYPGSTLVLSAEKECDSR